MQMEMWCIIKLKNTTENFNVSNKLQCYWFVFDSFAKQT